MRIFGFATVVVGISACLFAGFAGLNAVYSSEQGLGAIALAIAAVGIVAAGAVILRNSK